MTSIVYYLNTSLHTENITAVKTSLVKLVNDILWNMEKQLVTPIVILDLSAAFDTVDHDLLLGVLATRFGIQGKALEWYSKLPKTKKIQSNNRRRDITA